jgi:beta-phosphoglucomutase
VTPFAGGILDVDGVLVDSPHERAWRETLERLMDDGWRDIRDRTSYTPDRFTPAVYQQVIAGKPRMGGARAALDHFLVPDAAVRAEEYAELKQRQVEELIEAGEFTAFPDAVRFVQALQAAGIRLAAASSSKNADALLSRVPVGAGVTLLDCFEADTSGRDFAHGKPDPEIFLAAAEELGVAPGECFVVEDAVAGIQAAKAGGMKALGVARGDDARLLEDAGADLVVATLDEVEVAGLLDGVLRR